MLATCAVDAPRMRRGEDLLGRDVGIAGDAVLGGRGAALPFMTVGEADGEIGAGAGIMQRVKRWPFSHSVRLRSAALCVCPGRDGIGVVDARGGEDRVRQLADGDVLASSRKHQLRPGRARIGDDVPVDVEAGDLLQRRLIGDRIGLAGARDLGRVLAGQQHRIVADDGEPRGVGGERLRHAFVEPAGGAVEARVAAEAVARQRDLLVGEDRRHQTRRRPCRRARRCGAPAAAPATARSGTDPARACSCSPTLMATSASRSSLTGRSAGDVALMDGHESSACPWNSLYKTTSR